MRYLIDSDWVIDYLKGKSLTVVRLGEFATTGLAMSLITYGEVYEGPYFGRIRSQFVQVFSNFLEGVRLLELNPEIMQQFAYLRGNLRAQGQLIGDFDILIAGRRYTIN
jgi:tRNA(fMet)-specific endonuclease VapC